MKSLPCGRTQVSSSVIHIPWSCSPLLLYKAPCTHAAERLRTLRASAFGPQLSHPPLVCPTTIPAGWSNAITDGLHRAQPKVSLLCLASLPSQQHPTQLPVLSPLKLSFLTSVIYSTEVCPWLLSLSLPW